MMVVENADITPGDMFLTCVLHLGKITHILSKLNQGLLISNEINLKRAKILSENIECMGA